MELDEFTRPMGEEFLLLNTLEIPAISLLHRCRYALETMPLEKPVFVNVNQLF